MLTPASDTAQELTAICQGRFTGDPSHEFQVTRYHITDEDTESENVEAYKVICSFFCEKNTSFFCFLVIIT